MLKGYESITDEEAEKVKIEYNYHAHNYLCNHATGEVKDYVLEGIKNGLKSIGVSDHASGPIKGVSPYMDNTKLKEMYIPQFEVAEKEFGDKINIFSGVEVEYYAGCDGYYDELKDELDYLILGEHFFYCDGKVVFVFSGSLSEYVGECYFKQLLQGIKSKRFSICAHPDVIYSAVTQTPKLKSLLEDAVKACINNDVKLELNCQGIRNNGFRYPTDDLMELCTKYNAEVVISADAHRPECLCDTFVKKAYKYAEKIGLNIAKDGFVKKKR